ncbi:MAG: DUF5672 family protein [Candidatus Taylorbacteria bacterium]
MKTTVLIPIYKKDLTGHETTSLIQVCKILGKYDFSIVGPESVDVAQYTKVLEGSGVKYRIQRFADKYFESTKTYNLLMLERAFYEKFSEYGYMLIYQLDAYVFEDQLEYWCEQGYDFVGAPWMRFDFLRNKVHLLDAGLNGGFSLRKISSLKRVLDIGGTDGTERGREILQKFLRGGRNEDGFYSIQAKMIDPTFRVAPREVAMRFAFEQKPEKLFEMTSRKLPFGCHAWLRYDPEFWKKFIGV